MAYPCDGPHANGSHDSPLFYPSISKAVAATVQTGWNSCFIRDPAHRINTTTSMDLVRDIPHRIISIHLVLMTIFLGLRNIFTAVGLPLKNTQNTLPVS
jgi:hypothetical protein